jgi:tetratricopeptide (TPR) repeat protein
MGEVSSAALTRTIVHDHAWGPAPVRIAGLLAIVCLATGHGAAFQESRVTFSKDIAPIVWSRCAGCHRPGQVGPFSLVSYDEVKRHGAQIASVTARRLMPPWKPEPGKGEFEGARRLTDAEVQAIVRWVEQGAPEGDPADLPRKPAWGTGWQLGAPDLVASMPEAYAFPADGRDVFRTFVMAIGTTRARYVRAIEFRPDNPRVVHHANIGVDRTRSSRRLDGRDGEMGYSGSMVQDARYPEGQLLGWTPGQAPHAVPQGMQWRLDPGSDLIVQLHLQPTGKPERLKVSVGFYFTDEPPSRTPVGLRLGSETIDIAPGDPHYVVADRYVLPVDVDLFAVQPHAHNLARQVEASATRPGGTEERLIQISDWDFRWQDVYRFIHPLFLPKGTVISMRFVYDNSLENVRNPQHPPSHVIWGQNTTDEMGDLWLQVAPRAASDLAALYDDFRRKAHREDLAAYTKLLNGDPGNPLREDAVAALYFEDGRMAETIAHYRRSLQMNPSSPSTHYNIGIAYSALGKRGDAIAHFEEAVRLDPEYAQAHNNLGALLQLEGRLREAVEQYDHAIALRPDNLDARTNLALLLSEIGRPAEAAAQFLQALELRADHVPALAGLAWLRATTFDSGQRNPAEAVELAESADRATGHRSLTALDALAAAYAAAGRFDAAVEAARTAVQLATAAGITGASDRLRERLGLYQKGLPYLSLAPR